MTDYTCEVASDVSFTCEDGNSASYNCEAGPDDILIEDASNDIPLQMENDLSLEIE